MKYLWRRLMCWLRAAHWYQTLEEDEPCPICGHVDNDFPWQVKP